MDNPYEKGTIEHSVWERMPKKLDQPDQYRWVPLVVVGIGLAIVALVVLV